MPEIPTRGAVFVGPRRAPTVESLMLDDPGHGEVRVRMLASGVCRSDLHVVDGDWARPVDVVLGHEGAAVVEELGPGVTERPAGAPLGQGGLRVGDVVVLAWTAPCGRCSPCVRGEAWLCADPRGAGHRLAPDLVRMRRPDGMPVGVYCGIGTFGERQVVAAEAAIPVDTRMPPEIAALVGCAVTTGVGAVINTAHVEAGESVVVIGAGGVGLSAILAARSSGADPVIAVDRAPAKLALALRAGASQAVTPEQAGETVEQLSGSGADHVFEAIGSVATVELAVQLTRPGGTTTLVGMTPMGDRATFDVYRFVDEGRRLLGSNYGSSIPARDFPRICSLYLDGRLPLDLLVTERIGLEGLEGALDSMRRGDGARRVVIYRA